MDDGEGQALRGKGGAHESQRFFSADAVLDVQDGQSAPIVCGDSTVEDLNVHVLTVTVWPDGTVVRANNYIARAEPVPDGSVRMPDEGDVLELISYLTSFTENDTIVDLAPSSYSLSIRKREANRWL